MAAMRANLSRFHTLAMENAVPLSAVLLEVLWAYPWLVLLSTWQVLDWPKPPLSLWGALVLCGGAEIFSRLSLARNWSLSRVRLTVLSTLAILVTIVIRLEVSGGYALWDASWVQYVLDHLSLLGAGLAFAAYLLWRGMSIGRERLYFEDLYHRLLIGLTILVMLLILLGLAAEAAEFRPLRASTGLYIIVYFFVGLLGLALVNLRSIREEMQRHEGAAGLFNRRWLSLVLGVILGIIIVSVGIASAFSLDLLALLLNPLMVLVSWLLIALFYIIALPVGFLAAGLIYALRYLVSILRLAQPPQPFKAPDFSDWRKVAEGQQPQTIPPEIVLAIKWALLAIVVLVVFFALAKALFRYRRGKAEDDIEEIDESLWSWEVFKADLYLFFAGLWGRLRLRRSIPASVSPPLAVTLGEEAGRLFTVREIYQGLLWEGRRAGLPRHCAETPYEYEDKLARLGETGAPELHAITEAYVAEKYGELGAEREQLSQLNLLWHRLRSVLQARS